MSRRKLVSFLLLLAVAIAATSASPEVPKSEVGPAQENASDHSNGSLTGFDPENDAANYMDEAQENEEALGSEEDPEVEMAPDNTNWPLTGVDPRTDAANETEEALENDEASATDVDLETNFHFENEEANDDVTSPSDGLRIVNGISTSIRKHPYMVGLLFQRRYICCGSIVTDRYALTAGHCVRKFSLVPSVYTLIGGSEYLNRGWRYTVSFISIHPRYESVHLHYDAALLRITGAFNFNEFINRIPLTKKAYPSDGASAIASGWGLFFHKGPFPNDLQTVEMTIYSLRTCHKETGISLAGPMLCAGNMKSHPPRGTCNGDSGGPLVSGGELVGVESHRIRNSCAEVPAIYTNVYPLRSWIKSVTGLEV